MLKQLSKLAFNRRCMALSSFIIDSSFLTQQGLMHPVSRSFFTDNYLLPKKKKRKPKLAPKEKAPKKSEPEPEPEPEVLLRYSFIAMLLVALLMLFCFLKNDLKLKRFHAISPEENERLRNLAIEEFHIKHKFTLTPTEIEHLKTPKHVQVLDNLMDLLLIPLRTKDVLKFYAMKYSEPFKKELFDKNTSRKVFRIFPSCFFVGQNKDTHVYHHLGVSRKWQRFIVPKNLIIPPKPKVIKKKKKKQLGGAEADGGMLLLAEDSVIQVTACGDLKKDNENGRTLELDSSDDSDNNDSKVDDSNSDSDSSDSSDDEDNK